MLEIFGDFEFVGGENQAPAVFQDRQTCINFYPEVSPARSSKTATALLGCPGLIQVGVAPVVGAGAPGFSPSMTAWPAPYSGPNLPVRALWVLPNSIQALAVIANTVYLVTVASYGSYATPGALNLTAVGGLTTSSGPVRIRDNGIQGGFAVLVDGQAGYLYNINAHTLAQITDPNFLGPSTHIAEIDGWWIFNTFNPTRGSPQFFTNALPYATNFNASLFALKDAFSDILIGLMESKEELWLIGETTTEIWYDAGGAYFPFQRLIGTPLQVGCKAPQSIARLNSNGQDGLIWLGRSDRGENTVVRTMGLSAQAVSTPAVSHQWNTYSTTSDAVAYTYVEDGHEFYVLTFPTADRTWVYDATLPPHLAWHQRLSYDPYAQQFHRHRSNCYMNFGGMRIAGDYQNGALYQMTRAVQNDAGWPLLSRRRAPIVWNKDTRGRAMVNQLQVDLAPGQGASSGLGANPQATLRVSRDGGNSFGAGVQTPMGAIGQTRNRCIWRRLGWARDWIPEIEIIAPVNRDILGATIRAEGDT